MRLALATAFVLIVLPATTKGQSVDALSLQVGARARILGPTTDSQYTLIKVASATPDSLHYRLDHVFETRAIAWQQISKMEVSSGSHSRFLSGVEIGFLMGVVAGAAYGAATADGWTDTPPGQMPSCWRSLAEYSVRWPEPCLGWCRAQKIGFRLPA
jgi:hypothetical protein